ncbi:hypothetical protein [Luteibacter sp.]|uniref:hypothetical protein n=1 Tax=Luteibacter sp. TaxID=1886636 RepID=UPI003F7E85EB
MSTSKRIVRATAEIKRIPNKKPGQPDHGFQQCQLVDPDGGYERFELYFNTAKASFAHEPGEYTVEASEPKVVDGRLVIYPNLVPVKAARAAA